MLRYDGDELGFLESWKADQDIVISVSDLNGKSWQYVTGEPQLKEIGEYLKIDVVKTRVLENVHEKMLLLVAPSSERAESESAPTKTLEVLPLDDLIDEWQELPSRSKARVTTLLKNVKRLDEDVKSEFKLENLKKLQPSLPNLIEAKLNPRQTKLTNFFTRRDFNFDSQNDFNSQLLNTQYSERNSFQDSDSASIPIDLENGLEMPSQFFDSAEQIEESSSSADEVEESANIGLNNKRSVSDNNSSPQKVRKLQKSNTITTDKWDKSLFLLEMDQNKRFTLQPCQLLNISPAFYRNYAEFGDKELRLYFQRATSGDTLNIPNINCLEVIIRNEEEYLEYFGKLLNNSSKLRHFLKGQLSLTIKRQTYICHGYKLLSWKLENIEFVYEKPAAERHVIRGGLSNSDNSLNISHINFVDEVSRDQVIQFKDMIFEEENKPKFYIMYGYLLSCSTDNSNYANLVFTDFSKNSRYEQKYTFDRYIHEYSNKLEHDEGFRVISYYNHYNQFNDRIKDQYGKDLSEMMQENNNLGDKNVSKYGVLCRLVVKTKLYQSVLNIVERDIQLVSNITELTETERPVLERVIDKIHKARKIITGDGLPASSMQKRDITIPNRAFNADADANSDADIDISDYNIENVSDISQLHTNTMEKTIYVIMLTLIHAELVNNTHIRLRLTAPSTASSAASGTSTTDTIRPDRILDADIVGHNEVISFLAGDPMSPTMFQPLLREELRFKLRRRRTATNIVQWSPVECTIQELKLQRMLKLHQIIKQET